MARYRTLADRDLAWDNVRRQVEGGIRLELKAWEARVKNRLVAEAQRQFDAAVDRGELLELGNDCRALARAALFEEIDAHRAIPEPDPEPPASLVAVDPGHLAHDFVERVRRVRRAA